MSEPKVDSGLTPDVAPAGAEDAAVIPDVIPDVVDAPSTAATDGPPADVVIAEAPGADASQPDRATSTDGLTCGLLGQPCCPGLRCSGAEVVCVGADPDTATCRSCGRSTPSERVPCCAGNRCLDGSCCVHALSDSLGPTCAGVGTTCWELDSVCGANGSCGPSCGGVDQPCCHGLGLDYCSASGTACMKRPGNTAPSCVTCGQLGQPCCEQVLSAFSIEPCRSGFACRDTAAGKRCQN